ncbi:hypothetical protein VMCG_05348 [Cytospora schulzeri]|uniref:MalT-like TPR region domain-containing protein n=1 Tax=Cytospora schulzeri TaxID=448051 RepID=A0A423WJW5_9PEZI|nr:hypothetical protein VMCG_05348 [Valsa malicola]
MTVRQISAAYALRSTERGLDSDDLINEAETAIQDICYPFTSVIDGRETFEDTDEACEHAVRNWVYHLTSIEVPEDDILELLNEFISSLSFVHWAEFVVGDSDDFAVPFLTRNKLSRWLSTLPGSSKILVDISRYFEKPCTTLSKHYNAEGRDMELQWLCLYRLAKYFILGDYRRAHPVLQQIVEGLAGLLGPENSLTLRVKTDYATLLFSERKMKEAQDIFVEIWDIQREASPESTAPYNTLAYAGRSSYYMTDFELSKQQQQQAYGLLGSRVHGRDDGLCPMSLTARGQSERMLGDLKSARETLQQAWESRLRLWDLSRPNVIDIAIHLLIAYRESGLLDEAQAIISKLDITKIRKEQYLRHGQLTHIRRLLLYDDRDGELAIALLQQLLNDNKEGKEGNNRWLMWVRLSLAKIMTEHDQANEALGLLENIIRKEASYTGDLAERKRIANGFTKAIFFGFQQAGLRRKLG